MTKSRENIQNNSSVAQSASKATPLEKTSDRGDKHDEVPRGKGVAHFTQFIDIANKLVRVITWPLVVVIVLVLFYSPINRIVELLPLKLEKSNEVSFGSVSFKIQQQARASGYEELANIIRGLSQEAIEWVLKLGAGSHRVVVSDDGRTGMTRTYQLPPYYPVFKELAAKGLLKSTVDLTEYEKVFKSLGPVDGAITKGNLSTEQEAKLLNNSVELSESGRRAYEIIVHVVADLIKE